MGVEPVAGGEVRAGQGRPASVQAGIERGHLCYVGCDEQV